MDVQVWNWKSSQVKTAQDRRYKTSKMNQVDELTIERASGTPAASIQQPNTLADLDNGPPKLYKSLAKTFSVSRLPAKGW